MSRRADLDDVPWEELRTSLRGAAGRLRELVRGAADPAADPAQVKKNLAELAWIVAHCGMISQAAAYLPRFLARIAQRPEGEIRAAALDLLDTIAHSSPGAADEAGDRFELPFIVRQELVACLDDLRKVGTPQAGRLIWLIESEIVPGGVTAQRWRAQARPFLPSCATRLWTAMHDVRPVLVTSNTNWERSISWWDAATGQRLGGVEGNALHVYTGPAGLVAAGMNLHGRFQSWRIPSGEPLTPLRQRRSLADRIRRVKTWLPRAVTSYHDGERLALAVADDVGRIRFLDAVSGEPVREPVRYGGEITALWGFELSGRAALAVGDAEGRVSRWLMDTGEDLGPVAGKHHQYVLCGTAYCDQGRTVLVSGATDQVAYRWDAQTGEAIGDPWIFEDVVSGMCTYAVDGRPVVAVAGFCQVHRFDARTGEPFGELIQGHSEPVTDVCYAEVDGRATLFSTGFDVWRWDAVTGEPLPAQ